MNRADLPQFRVCLSLGVHLLAPLALFGLTFVILQTGGGWFTWPDLAFGLILLGMVLGARIERRASVAAGAPPCPQTDYIQSTAGRLILGLSIWIVANFMANHLLA